MRLNDTWLAVIIIALAAAIFGFTFTFPPFPGQKYGPSLFPRILAVGMVICAMLLIVRERRMGGRPALLVDPAFAEKGRLVSFLLVPASVAMYLIFAERLGFIPTAFALLAGLLLWFRVRLVTALAVAISATLLLNWFFGSLMRVPLPRGLFMQIIQGG